MRKFYNLFVFVFFLVACYGSRQSSSYSSSSLSTSASQASVQSSTGKELI